MVLALGPGLGPYISSSIWSSRPRKRPTELQNSKISNIIYLKHDLQVAEPWLDVPSRHAVHVAASILCREMRTTGKGFF